MSKKSSLGKGLGAILPDFLDEINVRPLFIMCGIEELSPNRFQSRKDFDDIEQKRLVESIKQKGIIQPIIVRKLDNGYEIVAGERRWRAALEAGIREVPIIIKNVDDSNAAEISLLENIMRVDLNPIEEAECYSMLMNTFNISQEELSNKVGKDRSTVANSLRLLRLPKEIKDALANKIITTGHARSLLSLDSSKDQLRLFQTILDKSLSVRETEKIVKNRKSTTVQQKTSENDDSLAVLEQELSHKFMTKVHISKGKNSGKIEIKFSSIEELNRLCALLNSI